MSIDVSSHEPGSMDESARTVWFGMRCSFTQSALEGAMASRDAARPVAIVLPGAPRPRTTGWPDPPFDRWLRTQGIAVIELPEALPADWQAVTEAIGKLRPSVGVIACFPHKVPNHIRQAFPHGMLNIHPSLLPRLRGPEPVFHACRLGLDVTGVSLHLVDDGWDTGPVLRQEAIPIPDDVDIHTFESSLARIGGEVLPETIDQWLAGSLLPRPQDDAQATWAPFPARDERIIPATLTVQEARRMVRMVGDAFGPLAVHDVTTGKVVKIAGLADDAGAPAFTTTCPTSVLEAEFAGGKLRFRPVMN